VPTTPAVHLCRIVHVWCFSCVCAQVIYAQIMGAAWFHDQMSWLGGAGSVVIALGVWAVNADKKHKGADVPAVLQPNVVRAEGSSVLLVAEEGLCRDIELRPLAGKEGAAVQLSVGAVSDGQTVAGSIGTGLSGSALHVQPSGVS
jgi:hypothetical protein